jgi:hypothetical protein
MDSVKVKLTFNPVQIKKMKRAMKKNEGVNIRLSKNQLLTTNGVDTVVSHQTYKKIVSAHKAGRGFVLKLDNKMVGGVLPALIALLSALGPALATGVATAGASFATKKVLDSVFPDKQEGKGDCGQGLTLAGTVPKGRGLTLAGTNSKGKGLRLAGSGKMSKKKMPKK